MGFCPISQFPPAGYSSYVVALAEEGNIPVAALCLFVAISLRRNALAYARGKEAAEQLRAGCIRDLRGRVHAADHPYLADAERAFFHAADGRRARLRRVGAAERGRSLDWP